MDNDERTDVVTTVAPTETQVGLSDRFISDIARALDGGDIDGLQERCRDLPAADAADLIVKLGRDQRHRLVETLEDGLHPETFSYLDPAILNDLLEHMPPSHVAAIVNELDSDDALHLIEGLEEDRRALTLRHLNQNLRAAVEEGLTYPEDSAGRMMQTEFVSIPQFWTVGKTVDYLRAAAHTLPERFYNIFIVDPLHRLVGTVALDKVLSAQRSVKVDALVNDERVMIPTGMSQDKVAFLFRRKDLLSAPVVDDGEHLVGVITVDDAVDIIHEEAERDFLSLSGVGDSDIHSPVAATARARFFWLLVNLATAVAASAVIGVFEKDIAKIALLAVLMPIVASMGGNAGTQTLAVAVRALATKDLTRANFARVIGKETAVGLINGVLFAVLIGGLVVLWYGNAKLGLVIGAAMIANLIAAGLAGAVIPIAMERLGYDPAQSAAVFLTTVTDIVGFFAFLGLARAVLL